MSEQNDREQEAAAVVAGAVAREADAAIVIIVAYRADEACVSFAQEGLSKLDPDEKGRAFGSLLDVAGRIASKMCSVDSLVRGLKQARNSWTEVRARRFDA